MKTAMEELIERFNSPIPRKYFESWLVKNTSYLLEQEKQQILDAYDDGLYNGELMNVQDIPEPEQYFNDKYK